MKKILYIITKSNWGGAQKYIFDLSTNLSSKYKICVAHGGDGLLSQKLKEKNIKTIPLKNLGRDISLLKELKVFFNLLSILKQEKPDIVHVNSSKIGGLGALAARLCNIKKIVFTAHGWPFNENRSWISKKIILFLSYLTTLLSHKTITVSQKELSQTSCWPFVQKKIEYIYNGVSDIKFKTKNESKKFLSKFIYNNFKRENNIVIGTIAELHQNKGLKYAIQAIAKLKKDSQIIKNFIYIIMGDGEEKRNLQKLIQKYDLENTIFLTGFVENAPIYLKAFDIFLLPSIKEGFCYVNTEAGLAELPVVSTNVGGTPEIIKHEKTGILIDSKNPKQIYSAIKYLLQNPEKRSTFGRKLKKYTQENFSIKQMLQKTLETYKN